jgi:hypothetical protein
MNKPTGKRWRPSITREQYRQIQAGEAREANRLRLEGWPVITGTPEEQAERHLEAIRKSLDGSDHDRAAELVK